MIWIFDVCSRLELPVFVSVASKLDENADGYWTAKMVAISQRPRAQLIIYAFVGLIFMQSIASIP